MSSIPTVAISAVPDPLPDGLHVLDVCEDAEWANGHIEGAQHIPLMEIPARVSEIPEMEILVVCKIGGRSTRAVGYLHAQGRSALNLEGGMLDWAAAGRPMVSENGNPPKIV